MQSRASGPRDHLPGPPSSPPGWDRLTTPEGRQLSGRIAALAAAGTSQNQLVSSLRAETADRDLLAAALTLADLRARATPKFGEFAPEMYFTQAGLEQASRLAASHMHAERFVKAGCESVADLGSGLGAESLSFLRAGLEARAIELDPLTAEFASRNLAVQAAHLRDAPPYDVLVGDATVHGAGTADGVFLDPARRTAGHRDTHRLTSAADYSPSLDFAFTSARGAKAGGVKLGPGFDRDLIPSDAEAEWVSVDGALVEMGLWFGQAAALHDRRVATVVYTSDGSTHRLGARADTTDAPVRSLGEYLIEPDGAVIRARLIGLLAQELGGAPHAGMIHPGIAYLTADTFVATPFAQSFRIVEELPAREKDLKKALQQRGIGRLEIKKRGVDVDPAALRQRLRLKGARSATLVLTRTEDRHLALLAERC